MLTFHANGIGPKRSCASSPIKHHGPSSWMAKRWIPVPIEGTDGPFLLRFENTAAPRKIRIAFQSKCEQAAVLPGSLDVEGI